jgi:GNAT superfamily N-acetyltransferase
MLPKQTYAAVTIRLSTHEDIPEILRQRRAMYEDMGHVDAAALTGMVDTSRAYLTEAFVNGSFHGWLAISGERFVGGGAIIVTPWLSHPYDLECRRATILNVYVYPKFRRRGIARSLMNNMIDWCKSQRFAAVYLHASKSGRPLYERMGFEDCDEMRLMLR